MHTGDKSKSNDNVYKLAEGSEAHQTGATKIPLFDKCALL